MELNVYGTHYDNVVAIKDRYMFTNSFAGMLETKDGERLAMLTVCIDDGVCNNSKDLAYVDTNNCKWAEKFIKENKLGEFVGSYGQSGFCTYPLYKFNTKKFKEYKNEI